MESKNQDIAFLRRKETIKNLIDNSIWRFRNDMDICDYTFSEFLEEICWLVSDNSDELGDGISSKINLIHKWVRNNFSSYIRKVFDRLLDSIGCNDY